MTTHRLHKALAHLQRALAPAAADAVGDAQLLGRFVATRDEAAFAALVRRHGPMVLSVCRRVLRHAQDAEDAFQATFLVLARKGAAVARREAVGSWLYSVAYRTARHVSVARARRQAREKQVDDLPHPQVGPQEAQDWRPLLDHELSRLPEKYRAVIVLCDLEGHTRKEAARQLRLPEGTLSSRLAAGRRLLAQRLSRRGVALSGGTLGAVVAQNAACARVTAPLVGATAKAAALAAAGHLAAVATPVAVLTKGVLRAMFVAKLKVVTVVVLVVAALGAGGLAYRSAAAGAPQAQKRPEGKSRSELEALRRENELLRLNLEVVLEKVRAQEAELRGLRGGAGPGGRALGAPVYPFGMGVAPVAPAKESPLPAAPIAQAAPAAGSAYTTPAFKELRTAAAARQVEAAAKELRQATDDAARRRAADALERALHKLRQQLTPDRGGAGGAAAKDYQALPPATQNR